MIGGQLGGNIRPTPEVEFTFGVAYYDFLNVQGRLSSPCFASNVQDVCDTDLTRPSFAQKGNTYMMLRDVIVEPGQPQFQFFGLASQFRDVVLSSRLDLGYFNPYHVILDGEYVRNVAWNRNDIAAKALVNGIAAGPATGPRNPPDDLTNVYFGGNQGWLARLTVGQRELKQLWDWNVHVGYKWLESDAVIDAFTDSDFGLGPNVWASARWMSANQIAGAPYAVDIIQIDLNGRF
jgi:hypothetical protein